MMALRVSVWYEQRRFKETKSWALRAVDAFEKLGTITDVENLMGLLLEKITMVSS